MANIEILTLAGVLIGCIIYFWKLRKKRNEDFMGLMIALSSLMELKDRYTEGHCGRVRNWVSQMGEKLGLGKDEIEDIIMAATLHDVGKVGIPDDILKKPAKLTEKEYEKIKEHPALGADTIQAIARLKNTARIIRHHHEWYNGSGYPGGIKGLEIPLGSRIIAVIDAFDAMMTDRTYRKSFPMDKALINLKEGKATQFDPKLVDIFEELLKHCDAVMVDPVCGMRGDKKRTLSYLGQKVYFCSDACLEEFRLNRTKYEYLLKSAGNSLPKGLRGKK